MVESSKVVVYATVDEANVYDVNKSPFTPPNAVVQGATNVGVMRLTIGTVKRTAIWKGLKLDRTISRNGITGLPEGTINKPTDIVEIKLWYDKNQNGLLDPDTDEVVNSNETPYSRPYFPYDYLAESIDSSTDVIKVTDIRKFFPDFSPFPNAPGRLIINDGSSPDKIEIVTYSGVDIANNMFTGVTRGLDGTTAQSHSTGTIVSGQAILTVLGSLGGQEITQNPPKDYIISFDINPLCTVTDKSNLGVEIPTTDYFMIISPDYMGNVLSKIGLRPPRGFGNTESYIGTIMEYSDLVTCEGADVITDQKLVQATIDKPIYRFTLETDVSEALWYGIRIYSTGTATSNNNILEEIKLVKVWYDANNNNTLQKHPTAPYTYTGTDYDVLIGSGAFANTGQPLMTEIKFPTDRVQTIITNSRAQQENRSQTYFVTFDVTDDAYPEQTVGIYLTADSIPMEPNGIFDPTKDFVSEPNTVNTTVFPYNSQMFTIFASSRTIYVTPTLIFADETATETSYTFDAPRLNGDITASQTFLTLYTTDNKPLGPSSPTDGFPDSGYIVIDNEIIEYNGKTADTLLNLQRGVLASTAVSHSSGTVVGLQARQGSKNLGMVKLEVWCDGFQVQWSSLTIRREQIGLLNGSDSDISAVRIYRDANNNGRLDRDMTYEVTKGTVIVDVPLGSGKFGKELPQEAIIPLNDPAINKGYELIRTATQVYFITFDIDPAAKFCHPQIENLNEVIGSKVETSYVKVVHPDPQGSPPLLHTVSPVNFPIYTPPIPIVATVDTLKVVPESRITSNVDQYQTNVGVIKMTLSADRNTVIWQRIELALLGTCVDGDISRVKIWKANILPEEYSQYNSTATIDGKICGLISYGTEMFADRRTTIDLKNIQTVSTTPTEYYVTFDISQYAQVGKTVGCRIENISAFTVEVPDVVEMRNTEAQLITSFDSNLATIQEVKSYVQLRYYDTAYDIQQKGGTYQAQERVEVLRLKLGTDKADAIWDAIQIERIGGSQNQNYPEGRNKDVKYIKIYKDTNFNQTLDATDTCISYTQTKITGFIVNNVLVNTLDSFYSPPLDKIYILVESTVTADGAFPTGASQLLVQIGDEVMGYSTAGSTLTVQGPRPYIEISERAKYGTQKLTHTTGQTISKVDMFALNDDLNKLKIVTLVQPQKLTPTLQTYFISYDIGENADAGNSVGARISDRAWIYVRLPNDVSPTIIKEPTGEEKTFTDLESSLITIGAIKLNVRSENLAPSSAKQLSQNVPLLQMRLWTDRNYITINQLNIKQTGTVLQPSVPGKGQGDFSKFNVWLDKPTPLQPYGDEKFDANTDIFIASATPSLYIPDSNNPAETVWGAQVQFGSHGLYISTGITRIFIVADIGFKDLADRSTEGDYAGIEITNFSNFVIIPQTALSDSSNSFPYKSGQLQILNVNAVIPLPYTLIPDIWANPFGDDYPAMDVNGDGNPDRIYKNNQVFLDLDNDGTNDLEDLNGDNIKNEVDIDGDRLHEIDIDGDGFLDVDINYDGYKDNILSDMNGDGIPEIDLFADGAVDDYLPLRWNKSRVKLETKWAYTSGVKEYAVALGNGPVDIGASREWLSTEEPKITISGLSLEEFKFTKLVSRIKDTDEPTIDKLLPIEVESLEGFNVESEGYIYVGTGKNAEIMHYKTASSQKEIIGGKETWRYFFNVDQRGALGTNKQTHESGTIVSNACYYYRIKAVNLSGIEGPAILSSIYRVDVKVPTSPTGLTGESALKSELGKIHTIKILWERATDDMAGIRIYEVQEAKGTDPRWKTIQTLPFTRQNLNLERESGVFYYYRIRAQDCAGNWSQWSSVLKINTGIPSDVITSVSNYPNPLDLRKGDAQTYITYILNQDAEVTVTLYDLLGYKVYEWRCSPGELWSGTGKPWVDGKGKGGAAGVNVIIWEGKNEAGDYVSKGGYIAQIKVKSDKGTVTATRKIGVIR